MILLIDNYDSFTYNLAHLFGELGARALAFHDRLGRAADECDVVELEQEEIRRGVHAA